MQDDADILNLDIVHILEFAYKQLIQPIPLAEPGKFFKSTKIPSKSHSGKYWAAPFNADVGMLFSRRGGHSDGPPSMGQALEEVKAESRAFVAQLESESTGSHEAFVVNVLEHALAVEPQVLSEEEGRPSSDLELWLDALKPRSRR